MRFDACFAVSRPNEIALALAICRDSLAKWGVVGEMGWLEEAQILKSLLLHKICRGEIMKIYNKLVRDKIPQIIENNNEICKIRVLNDQEYLVELNKKMVEEMNEYLQSGEIEELADLEEVLRAILDVKKCSYDKFETIRKTKVEKRGAFKNKLFLESTKDNREL